MAMRTQYYNDNDQTVIIILTYLLSEGSIIIQPSSYLDEAIGYCVTPCGVFCAIDVTGLFCDIVLKTVIFVVVIMCDYSHVVDQLLARTKIRPDSTLFLW